MDPQAALEALRALCKAVAEEEDGSEEATEVLAECALEFRDYFEALDEWIKKGGFLPADWKR